MKNWTDRNLKRWSIMVMLVAAGLMVACGGQKSVTDGEPTVDTGPAVPAHVQSAHQAVLDFLRDGAAECVPQVGVNWQVTTATDATPPGYAVYRYNAGGCDMTIAYAEPESAETTYYVALGDTTSGFCWQAMVDSRGRLIRTSNDAAIDPAGNPAALYCEAEGHTYEIRERADGVLCGVCVFPDQSVCKGWDYFHGTCAPGDIPLSEQ